MTWIGNGLVDHPLFAKLYFINILLNRQGKYASAHENVIPKHNLFSQWLTLYQSHLSLSPTEKCSAWHVRRAQQITATIIKTRTFFFQLPYFSLVFIAKTSYSALPLFYFYFQLSLPISKGRVTCILKIMKHILPLKASCISNSSTLEFYG